MSIKYIIRCAVASLALFVTASCDMSEIVDSESISRLKPASAGDSVDSDIIAFTMAADTSTKAQNVTTANITAFEVTAFTHGMTTNPYFNAVAFTGGSGTFASDTPHYWPASGALDFYAWSVGSATGQVVKNSYKSFTVTPSANPALQADLVFACSGNRTKAGASGGVIPLAFAKTMSRVSVKVKNTSSDYKFQVTGWKVGYVATTGTFTYSGSGTSAGTQLPVSMWSGNTTRSADRSYSSTFSTVNVAANASTPMTLAGEMVLVPQSGAAATGYASASTGAALNGSYVAIRMAIRKASDDSVVQAETWAVWPTEVSWEPGKGYVYTVDLAGGGYFESNQEGTDAELDPIISQEVLAPGFIIPTAANITVGEPEVITIVTSMNMEAGTDWGIRLVGPGGSTTHTGTLGIPGTGSMTINGLAAGSYTVYPYITVDGVTYGYEYGSDPAYFQTNTFTVKNATVLDVVCNHITVGDTESIMVYAPMSATGNITLSVNGNSYTQALTEGCAEFAVSGLPVGSYTAVATYAGDASYSSATASNNFTVSLPEHVMTVSVDDIYVGDKAVVTLTTNVAGTYTLQIDGGTVYSETVTDELLEATWNISGLSAGNKTAVVRFAGNGDYPEKGVAETFTVSKKSSAIQGRSKSTSYPKDVVLTIDVPSYATGYIEIVSFKKLNTSTSEYEDFYDYSIPARGSSGDGRIVNGKSKLMIQGLPNTDASYKIVIYYSGNDIYNPSDVISINISYKKSNV